MYQSLQACRAAAALLVVLFHLGGTFAQQKYFGYAGFDRLFSWGDSGVDFFFVLSGFLITTVHRRDFGHPEALPRYLLKRAVRIYPTYWLICLAVCLAALLVPALRAALPSEPLVFLRAFLLIPQDPDVVGGLGSPILFVAWSLQYEMMFYAVVAAFIFNRGLGWGVVAALLVLNLGCAIRTGCTFPASFVASDMVFLFALGVGVAYLLRSPLRLPRPRLVAALAGAGFVGFGVLESWIGRDALPFDRRLVFGVLAAVLVLALCRAEDAGMQVPARRTVGLLGDSSYALYLLHIPIISLLCKALVHLGVTSPAGLVGLFTVVVVACVGAAAAYYLGIERHLLAALRFGSRKTAAAGAARPVPVSR